MIWETTTINLLTPISKKRIPQLSAVPLTFNSLKNHPARINDPDSLPGPKGTLCYCIRYRRKHWDSCKPLGNQLVTAPLGPAPFSQLLWAFHSNKSPVCSASPPFLEYVIIMPNHPPLVLQRPDGWCIASLMFCVLVVFSLTREATTINSCFGPPT